MAKSIGSDWLRYRLDQSAHVAADELEGFRPESARVIEALQNAMKSRQKGALYLALVMAQDFMRRTQYEGNFSGHAVDAVDAGVKVAQMWAWDTDFQGCRCGSTGGKGTRRRSDVGAAPRLTR